MATEIVRLTEEDFENLKPGQLLKIEDMPGHPSSHLGSSWSSACEVSKMYGGDIVRFKGLEKDVAFVNPIAVLIKPLNDSFIMNTSRDSHIQYFTASRFSLFEKNEEYYNNTIEI